MKDRTSGMVALATGAASILTVFPSKTMQIPVIPRKGETVNLRRSLGVQCAFHGPAVAFSKAHESKIAALEEKTK